MRNEFEDRLSATETDAPTVSEMPAVTRVDAKADAPACKPAVVEEVLIEEVSIDGMCGVY